MTPEASKNQKDEPSADIVKSETVPCPVCGTVDVDVMFSGDGYSMGKCRICRLVRESPRLTADWMRRMYYDGERQKFRHGTGRVGKHKGTKAWESKPKVAYMESVKLLETVLPGDASKGVWVDVGCATGSYLVAARDSGWNVSGVEIGTKQVQICREEYGLDVFLGTLQEAGYADGYAEVVSYRQVLEHVHDLHGELAEACRVLKPGGFIFVEIPHYGGAKYRVDTLRAALGLMKKEDVLHYVPAHLYYFTRDQIVELLRVAGFDTVFTRTYGKWRSRRGPFRRAYEFIRDGLGVGNKIRVIARKRVDAAGSS